MGKQVRFFSVNNDEINSIEFICSQGGSIVDTKNQKIELSDLNETPVYTSEPLNKPPILKFYVVFKLSNLSLGNGGYIDPIVSDVIEFSRSVLMIKDNHYIVEPGRIWAEFSYHDAKGKKVYKEKWFNEKFRQCQNWIKNNFKMNKDRDHFIGEEAYRLYQDFGYKMKSGPLVEEIF